MRGFYHSRIFPSVTAQPGDFESLALQLLLLLFDGYRPEPVEGLNPSYAGLPNNFHPSYRT